MKLNWGLSWFSVAILLVWMVLAFSCVSSQQPQKVKLDPVSEQFLDNVSFIILPVEEKIFREMPPEDRGEFIRDFWARRDPDPSTPGNEYRQTYYTRLAIADRAFKVGKPGRKTDRGRIYILFGPPTNVITKSMGDVPYEQRGFVKANPLESGTITERATEIWIYDNYPEYFAGPLRLVFVDYYGTGDYRLETKLEITPFSMVAPEWDPPNLAKYQWVGEIAQDEKTAADLSIFDYNATAVTSLLGEGLVAQVKVDIPFARLDFRQEGENYTYDLLLSVEIRDGQKNIITHQAEEIGNSLSLELLKSNISNQVNIHREWTLDLPPQSFYIYISVTDKVRGKRLRKLLKVTS
ncbi:MAG TPA: GWxTD domain-containing protein [Candidatus Aminicenantes bacterium]|nr:GWxTD domain-containing protein [Candidatus Aminicenantes bacterium]